ncbi:hypothetical protein ACC724_39060, partial [Rhizobium ruizarguesonis]
FCHFGERVSAAVFSRRLRKMAEADKALRFPVAEFEEPFGLSIAVVSIPAARRMGSANATVGQERSS